MLIFQPLIAFAECRRPVPVVALTNDPDALAVVAGRGAPGCPHAERRTSREPGGMEPGGVENADVSREWNGRGRLSRPRAFTRPVRYRRRRQP
jgi:hypothetical protein